MDRKLKALEAELKAIIEATDYMSHLLKSANNMAAKVVDTCKCIPKSKTNEKLESYMLTTTLLAQIKSRIVTDSVTLEKFLYSIGYSEDQDEDTEDSMEYHTSTVSPDSDNVRVQSNIHDSTSSELCPDNILNHSNSVRFDLIANSVNVESINVEEPINSQSTTVYTTPQNTTVISEEVPGSTRPLQTSDHQSENIKEVENKGDDLQAQAECSAIIEETKSNPTHNQLDVEQFLKQKKLMSLEDKYVNSVLEKSHAPDLRLRRSSSSSSSSSFLCSSKSSGKTDGGKMSMSKMVQKSHSVNSMESGINKQSVNSNHSLSDHATSTNIMDFNSTSENTLNKVFLGPRLPIVGERCAITSFKNPQNLYIQLHEQSDSLLALNVHLNVVYENSKVQCTNKPEAKENIGDNCVAYYEDYNSWYRIKVLDWQLVSHTNTVLVFLIDYGDINKVPVENLRKLLSEFFDIPMFAIPCSLEHLYPPSSTDNNINTIWTTAELSAFYEFMQGDDPAIYRLTYVNTESDPVGIDLIDEVETDPDKTLGQNLFNANIVKQILPDKGNLISNNRIMLEQIKTVQGLQGMRKNMTETERLEKFLENDCYKESKNIVEAATGYDANDERRVCKFTRSDGTCFKGANCKLEHKQLRPDGFTTDKNFIFHKAFYNFVLPCVDDEIKIYITCITQSNEFYGHILERDEMKIYGTSLQQLSADLKNPHAVKKFKRLDILPTIGQIVLAKNWDGTWCRARVIDIDGLTADVFIVDYGETVTVKLEDLREISRDYLVLPFQAVKFHLWDIEKVPDIPEEEVVTYMETHYLCDEYTAIVKACNPHIYVDVRIIGDIDMRTDLVTQGFGKKTSGKQLIIETSLVD